MARPSTRPGAAPTARGRRQPSLWWVNTRQTVEGRRRHLWSSEEVALTFDDGPDPLHTPLVLDALSRLGVKATFFCVGERAAAHPEIVARMAREGHAVGSHSSAHPDFRAMSLTARMREMRKGKAEVETALGRRTSLFRPPMGHNGIQTLAAMRLARVRGWLWSVDPKDLPRVSAADIALGTADVTGGDVILLHDSVCDVPGPESLDRSATITALDEIVGVVRERGLRLVVLH